MTNTTWNDEKKCAAGDKSKDKALAMEEALQQAMERLGSQDSNADQQQQQQQPRRPSQP